MKKYKGTLTAEKRQGLHELIAAGKASAKKVAHARILLEADAKVAEAVEVSVATVERVRALRRAGARGRPGPQEARPPQPCAEAGQGRRGPADRFGLSSRR